MVCTPLLPLASVRPQITNVAGSDAVFAWDLAWSSAVPVQLRMQETRRAETGQLRRRIESIPGIAQPAAGNDRDVSLMADYQ